MGFGGIGRACLQDLIEHGFEVAGVFCRATDRDGSGDASSVFAAAREAGLHCFAEVDPSAPAFLAEAVSLAPDLLLSVQYDRILKPALISIPRKGAYNLHFGPLPRLRGCFPTKWAIIEDEPAGVAFHCIDPGIDSGDVIDRAVVPLATDETDQSLYDRLQVVGHEVFRRQLAWMRRLDPPQPQRQDESRASYHPKQLPYGGILDWQRDAPWLERFVRAFTFPPHPAAKTWLLGEQVEILAPVSVRHDLPRQEPGQLVATSRGDIAVACGAGHLVLNRLRMAGAPRTAEALRPAATAALIFRAHP
jgi:methionyl-tRNA formyltransferase